MSNTTCSQKIASATDSNFKWYAKVGTFLIVSAGVWVLFSVPVIVYHLQQVEKERANESDSMIPANYSVGKPLNCSPQFSFNEKTGLCSPICGQWSEFSQDQVAKFTVTTVILYVFHIIGTVIALIFSCYNHEIMFKLPGILLLYYIASPIILDISFFIRLIGRENLLCSSSDLFEAIEHSTPFCYFSGIITNFIFTMIGYCWLFLSVMIFWKVWFPTNARNAKVKGYMKYIHIAIVATSLVLSMLPVATALGTGGFVISSFPVYLNGCYPRNSAVFFYAFILPICIISQPAGCTFNLLTLYKVMSLKQNLLNKGGNLRGECRLLAFLFYFAFAVGVNLILVAIGNVSQIQQGLKNYFTCEAFGLDPDDPCILETDRHREHALTIAGLVVYTIGPYATLVYATPVEKIKYQWRKLSPQQNTHTTD